MPATISDAKRTKYIYIYIYMLSELYLTDFKTFREKKITKLVITNRLNINIQLSVYNFKIKNVINNMIHLI